MLKSIVMLAAQVVVLAIAAVATSQYLSVRTRIDVAAGDAERFAEREAPVESAAPCVCEESAPCVCSCEPVACECSAPPACAVTPIPTMQPGPLPTIADLPDDTNGGCIAASSPPLLISPQDAVAAVQYDAAHSRPVAHTLESVKLTVENSNGVSVSNDFDPDRGGTCWATNGSVFEQVARYDGEVLIRVAIVPPRNINKCPVGTLSFMSAERFDAMERNYQRALRMSPWRERVVREAEAALLHDAR